MGNALIAIAVFLLLLIFAPSCSPRDDSDAPNKVSGMGVHKDALTGCEYLSRAGRGLTPRMRADGTQVCRNETPWDKQ